MEKTLVLRNLCKQYDNRKEALKGISFTFSNGIYGILGPNGAGKSTLIGIITQGMRQTSGEVLYGNEQIWGLGAGYRRIVGYMPQQQALPDYLSGRRFLWYMAALKGMPPKDADRRSRELLCAYNLAEMAGRKIGTYSGGMRQRLLLAQAMLDDPGILVLDEPTAGLDPQERIRFRNILGEMGKNKIVIVATHVVSDIECIAKEILLIKEGKLIANGSAAKLIGNARGYVWEKEIESQQLPGVEKKVCVSSITQTGERFLVRIVSEKHYEGWRSAVPTLEEVYLYYFSGTGFM